MIALTALIFVLWFLLFVVLFRVPPCKTMSPPAASPRLSVVIPARDEERNLPRLLDSLTAQEPKPLEIIVVDDGSSDATADLARERGVEVVASEPLPDGWRGKTWACMQGAQRATGDILLFVDADTFFEPGGLRRILGTYRENPGVLSVGAYHKVVRLHEELSAYFNIMMTAGTGAFTLFSGNRSPAGLFGPFLMVDRRIYDSVGGHRPVRDKILENFHFAKVFREAGASVRCCGGRGSFNMRMYPDGVGDLISGWSKAFASGAVETPRWILLSTVAWITGSMLTIAHGGWAAFEGLPAGLAWAGALYLLYAVQLAAVLRRIGSFRYSTAFLFPVPLFFYLGVFTWSAVTLRLKRKVSWKGRDIEGDSVTVRKG